MFCAKCGKELNEDAKFCKSCGAPTGAAEGQQTPAAGVSQPPETGAAAEPPPAAPPLESPLPPGPLSPEQMPQAYPGEFIGAPKRRISVPALIAIIALVVVLLVVAITVPAILVYKGSQKNAQKRTCQANQRNVEAAVMGYAASSSDENYPSSLDDLVAPDTRVLKSVPTCPSGNKPYIWVEGEIGSPPSISCPNHADHAL